LEPNKSNTKFRYELEKTWDTERRLKLGIKIILEIILTIKTKNKMNLPDLQAKLRTEKLITNKEKIDLRDALIVAFDRTRSDL
jgi:hypothetical protein